MQVLITYTLLPDMYISQRNTIKLRENVSNCVHIYTHNIVRCPKMLLSLTYFGLLNFSQLGKKIPDAHNAGILSIIYW